jgi:mono/diheme cytochrome c family protein
VNDGHSASAGLFYFCLMRVKVGHPKSVNIHKQEVMEPDLMGTPRISFAIAVVGVVGATLAVDSVRPASAADAFNGKRLAERWCAACHVVSATQREAYADAPPFEDIAKRPNFSQSGLMTFLLDPHAKMPNMDLTRIEAGDIAAYIGTLR